MHSAGWLTSLLLLPAMAIAQTSDSYDDEDRVMEEVTVTAQYREQSVLDVPMAITTLDGAELIERNIYNIQDLSFAVPGMSMREDGPGSYTIFLRGLANTSGPGALVGVYLDEAPLSLTGYDQMDVRTMDLERVEVLKGPQGTLYGQGAVAGVVRYITKDPDLESVGGSIEGQFYDVSDGENGWAATGVLNLPVVKDVFGLRIAATMADGGGWIDQPQAGIYDGNGQDLQTLRVKGLWQATERFTAEAMVVVHRNDVQLGLGYEQPDRTALVGIDRSRVLLPKEYDYDLYNLNLTFDLGFAELLSATTYIEHDQQYPFSYIGGDQTIYGGNGYLEGVDDRYLVADQFTQEFRLVSTGEGPLQWTAGLFYRDVERTLEAYYDTLFAGVVYPDAYYYNSNTYENYAIFADVSYDFTERLTVGAGIRYFDDDQSVDNGSFVEEDSFDSTDPRIYATYRMSDHTTMYGSVASGFRSGGFNRGDLPNYQPESVTSYEFGLKGTTAGGRLGYDVAAYYSDYDDMVRRGLVFVNNAFQSLTSNIGKVEVKGLEGGLDWRTTDQLSLYATVSYIDSEVTQVDSTDAVNIVGDPVDYVPEWSYTLGGQYDFRWFGDRPGYFRADYSYRDEVDYVDRSSFPDQYLPQQSDSISLLSARLGMIWDQFTLELFARNLSDTNKYIDPYWSWANANRTMPRSVGILGRYEF